MIVNDRAGGTSHGSGNAPAHLFSAATVLTPSELLDRLAEKGVVVDDSEIGARLVSTIGYRHIVRYVPALKRVYAKPTVSLLANAVHSDSLFQNLLLLYSSQFERAFKTRLSSALAAEFGARAHTLPWIFKREKDCEIAS